MIGINMGLIRVEVFTAVLFAFLTIIKLKIRAAICLAVLVNVFTFTNAQSQSADGAPAQTQSIVSALEYVEWHEIEEGLKSLSISTPLGIRLHAFKISPDKFTFSVEQQANMQGETVEEFATRTDALIAINGGFFAKHSDGSLSPVGLLIDEGIQYTRAWAKKGGFLIAGSDGIKILPSKDTLSGRYKEVIQTRPVIIEAGKKWALNRNLRMSKNRTLVCVQEDKQVVLLTFSGLGLSLFEAGWTLRSEEWGGWFDCDCAIALDGGGSTQLHVKDHPDFSVFGDTNVQNALLVKRVLPN